MLSWGVESTCSKLAAAPLTLTAVTFMSWKSRLKLDRFCVAVALIVVVAELNRLATGS